MCTHAHPMYTRVTHVCTHVHVHVCICTCGYMSARVLVCTHVHMHMYTCVFVCVCVCIYLGGTIWGNENLAVMQLSGILRGISCFGVPPAPSADSEFLSRPTSSHLVHASFHTQVQKPALLEIRLKPRGFWPASILHPGEDFCLKGVAVNVSEN